MEYLKPFCSVIMTIVAEKVRDCYETYYFIGNKLSLKKFFFDEEVYVRNNRFFPKKEFTDLTVNSFCSLN